VWTLTGKIPPSVKAYADKHKLPVLGIDEYQHALEWVKKHLFVVYPRDRHYKNIFDEFMFFYEVMGVDHFEIDPWNVVALDPGERGDERLVKALVSGKDFVMKTNTLLSIVNHAKSMREVKETSGPKKGQFKVITQFDQLGGIAWDMKLDGQFSVHRPHRHKDPNSPVVHLYNLKQRDVESVGAERGVYEDIEFDRNSRRYFFKGVCPIDGSIRNPTVVQESIPYVPSYRRNKKAKSFDDHVQQDWAQPTATDEPPWVTS
jgi:hypothetical protein